MTRSNLIFTHASVFAVGIAAAMIVNGLRGPAENSAATAEGTNLRSSHSGPAGQMDGEIPSGHHGEKSDARLGSKKENKPPVDQLSDIVRMTDPLERQRALMDLVDKLGPGEFEGVADRFRELDHLSDSGGEYDLILRSWAKADPLTALGYVEKFPNSQAGRSTILSMWAGNDPAAAEKWALDHHEGDGPNPHMAAVIRGIAGHDVNEASRLAQSMPQSRERAEAVDAITRALFLQSPEAAMAFPASITDPQLRGGFVSAIADRMIGKDVNKAATWVASMDQGEVQNRAARVLGDALAKEDTTKAAAWVKTLKPEAQVEAARGVIPIMSSADIAGTAQWVSSLAGTPNYDQAVEEFVWSCNTRAPEQSAAWILGVSNPDQQRRLFNRMLGEWAQRDAAAVKQWVASNNVPPDVLRRFSR